VNPGLVWGSFVIPGDFLNNGVFTIHVILVKDSSIPLLKLGNVVTFEVNELERSGPWYGKFAGVVRPKFDWTVEVTEE
ncbi:MAG: ABC transporter ATP-binding protein, partial [Thermoplasmata archaeon]|nr:ABC transporter ATP-binding protein [Thermoplasmata archaeon]